MNFMWLKTWSGLNPQIEWISGLGLQLGHYSVKRDVRNNYQQLASKGRTMIGAANLYTGFVYSYPLPDDLIFRAKGILSYSFVQSWIIWVIPRILIRRRQVGP